MGKNGPPTSQYSWEQLSSHEELREAGLDMIRQMILYTLANPAIREPLRTFYTTTLAPYWDTAYPALSREASSAIYRLSSELPVENRKDINVWPSTHGKQWISLETWRRAFEQSLRYGENDIYLFSGEMPKLGVVC